MEANDNGLTYSVVFFEGPGDDARETHRVGGFENPQEAMNYAIDAHAFAKRNNIPWFATEIVFE